MQEVVEKPVRTKQDQIAGMEEQLATLRKDWIAVISAGGSWKIDWAIKGGNGREYPLCDWTFVLTVG